MPNHVLNELTIHGLQDGNARHSVLSRIGSSERAVDFQNLLPLPLNFWPGSVSSIHEDAFLGTHLDAARNTWGTKWNAYGLSGYAGSNYQTIVENEADLVLTFQTAWGPPVGWIMALFNSFEARMTHHWLDEGAAGAVTDEYDYSLLTALGRHSGWVRSEASTDIQRRMEDAFWGKEGAAEIRAGRAEDDA